MAFEIVRGINVPDRAEVIDILDVDFPGLQAHKVHDLPPSRVEPYKDT